MTNPNKPTSNLDVLQRLNITDKDINQCLSKGQCSKYTGSPDAETYFKLELELADISHNDWLSDVPKLIIQSGKYLGAKSTQILLTNCDGEVLSFGFHNNKICYSVNGEKQELDCTPTNGNVQAYESVLDRLYLGQKECFVTLDLCLEALRIITPALLAKNVKMHKYEAGWSPTN